MKQFKLGVAWVACLAINTFAHPCLSDRAMRCNATVGAATIMFVIYCIIQLIAIARKECSVYMGIVDTLLASGIAATMYVIGGCSKADMACRISTFPVLSVSCIVLILCGLITVVTEVKRGAAQKES